MRKRKQEGAPTLNSGVIDWTGHVFDDRVVMSSRSSNRVQLIRTDIE